MPKKTLLFLIISFSILLLAIFGFFYYKNNVDIQIKRDILSIQSEIEVCQERIDRLVKKSNESYENKNELELIIKTKTQVLKDTLESQKTISEILQRLNSNDQQIYFDQIQLYLKRVDDVIKMTQNDLLIENNYLPVMVLLEENEDFAEKIKDEEFKNPEKYDEIAGKIVKNYEKLIKILENIKISDSLNKYSNDLSNKYFIDYNKKRLAVNSEIRESHKNRNYEKYNDIYKNYSDELHKSYSIYHDECQSQTEEMIYSFKIASTVYEKINKEYDHIKVLYHF